MIYFIFFFFVALGFWTEEGLTQKMRNRYFYFLVVSATLFCGLRDMIGGYDVYIYGAIYESPSEFILKYQIFEVGFNYYFVLLRFISENREFLFLTSAVITYFLIQRAVKEHSHLPLFVLFIIYAKFFLMSFVYVRQALAMAIIWQSIHFITKRKLIPYVLLCVLAFSFHKSSAIFFPMYFVATLKFNKAPFNILTVILIMIAISPLSFSVVNAVTSLFGNDKMQLYVEKSGDINIFYFLEAIIMIVLLFVFQNRFYQHKKTILVYNGLFFYSIINLFAMRNASFIRFSWYYLIFLAIALQYVYIFINESKDKLIFKTITFVYFSLLCLRLLFLFDDGDFLPYKSILEDFNRNGRWEYMEYRRQ